LAVLVAHDFARTLSVSARYLTRRTFRHQASDVACWFADGVKTHFAPWIASSRDPFITTLVALPAPEVNTAGLELPYSDEALQELVAGVHEDKFSHFSLDITDHGSGASLREVRPGVATIAVDLRELNLPPGENEIVVRAAGDVVQIPPGLGVLKGCLLSAAEEIGDGNGALGLVGSFKYKLAHASVDRSHRQEADDALRKPERWLQGVHWGNMLGPYHVDILGGPERVADSLPRALCLSFGEQDDEQSLYIQASAELPGCTLDDMISLHEVLRPVLPRPFSLRAYAEPIMARELETLKTIFS
jgi:hypothetical protein